MNYAGGLFRIRPNGFFIPIGFQQLIAFVFLFAALPTVSYAVTITQWTFEGDVTTPSTGSGTAALIGGTTATFAAGNGGGRGWNTTTYPAQSTGNKTRGVEFAVSTAGYQNIVLTFDLRHSNTSSSTLVVQYSTDGTTFTDFTSFKATAGDIFFARTVDLSTITALNNNANAKFRVLSAFDPPATGTAYTPTNSTSTYATTGTWRFDNVTISGDVMSSGSAPTITFNTSTSDFIDGGVATSPASPFATSGVLSDPTDPVSTLGINFTIADSDTPIGSTSVTASSSNTTVVPNANIAITGSGTANVNVKITPAAVGYATITVTASDGSNNATYVINYAASAASVNPGTTRFHTGKSDASTAIAIDANYMFVADDEDEVIRLYSRSGSGLPSTGFNFNPTPATTGDAPLGLPEANREVDLEAATRVGNTIYWLGSHSNSSSGNVRPNRYRLFSTTVAGSGASSTLTFDARYDHLRTDLITWDTSNAHGKGANFYGLSASAASGVAPESSAGNGFSIEGFTVSPSVNTTAYIAFRAPIVPASNRTKALIVPWTNFSSILNATGGTAGSATFGAPIELDLGGRGLRSIECNSNGCLIIAGPPDAATGTAPKDFRLYTWTGNAVDAPVERSADLTALQAGGSFESIVELPMGALSTWGTQTVQLLVDNGDTIWYGGSIFSKDLPQANHQKFRSELVQIDAPLTVSSFTPTDGSTSASPGGNLQVQFNRNIAFGSSGTITLFDAGNNVVETFNVNPPSAGLSISGNTLTINPTNNLMGGTGYYVQISNGAIQDTNGSPFAGFIDDTTWNFTTVTLISQIQGNSSNQLANLTSGPTNARGAHDDRSPLVGQTVTIEGIVTGDFQLAATTPNNVRQLRGFFIQEETVDEDEDSTTSEGLFVFTGDSFLTNNLDVQEGQKVRVTGTVSEFFGMTQVSATSAGSVTVIDTGNNLAQITPATIDLPVVGDRDDFYEQFEGMKVTFQDKLYVSEYFELARYGQIVLTEGGRPYQYTHDDNTPTTAEFTAFQEELARRQIILDDDDNTQNSPLVDGVGKIFYPQTSGFSTGTQGTNFFRGGDTISGLTGILHWSFAGLDGTDAWRIRPTQADVAVFTVENPRPTNPPNVGGNITVASYNVLNYFLTIDTTPGDTSGPCGPSQTLDCRGPDSTAERDRQQAKLTVALHSLNADVIGLIELENTLNVDPLAKIVADLNDLAGSVTYAAINTGLIGNDAIRVGMIYKFEVVEPVGSFAVLSAASFTDPNSTGQQRNRPALAQTFRVKTGPSMGERFNLVVNHFKSKGSSTGAPADADQNDGQGASNDTRTKAAQALAQWLATDPTGQGDPDWLIVGDLNAYKGENPITALKNAGYTDLVEQFGGADAYSYVFNSQLGYLDHALANASLLSQVTGATEWHINADESSLFDYNDTVKDTGEASFEAKPSGNPLYEVNAFRTSDHDPVLVGLNLSSLVSTTVAEMQAGDFNGDGRSDILLMDTNRQLQMYLMTGASVLSQVNTGAPLGPNVRVDGIGDFNGDGRSDILLRDTVTQTMTIRIMSGASVLAQVNLAPMPPGDTRGAADFNGDGRADIVFQNPTTGQVTIWIMSGASILAQVNVGTSPDPIQGLGDVNGDGRTDILIRSGDQLKLWIMNGASILSQPNVGLPITGMDVVAMGDFNKDGRADILLRSGDNLILRVLSGASVLSQITLGSSAAGLETYGVGDLNGDGRVDIVQRYTGGGALRLWVMSGGSILSQVNATATPASTTAVIAPR